MHKHLSLPALCALLPLAAACASSDAAATEASLQVTSTADTCEISASEVPSGDLVFEVTNTGSDVTEFYLLAADGQQVVGEVENIGPGITRDLAVNVTPGDYIAACKPGMVGDGIRTPLTVIDSGDEVS